MAKTARVPTVDVEVRFRRDNGDEGVCGLDRLPVDDVLGGRPVRDFRWYEGRQEQMRRLERDIGTSLFHRATPASQTQHPTPRGTDLLRALATHGIQGQPPSPPQPTAQDLPPDLLHAVQGQHSGWARLERFTTAMSHPTINAAAAAIGINRTTLIDQLHRLEADLDATLFHRATSDGRPQRPTNRGHDLLAALNRADVQPLRAKRARLPRLAD